MQTAALPARSGLSMAAKAMSQRTTNGSSSGLYKRRQKAHQIAGLSEAAMQFSVKTPARSVQSHSFLLSGAPIRFLCSPRPPQALAIASRRYATGT
jgi:hypothetical protein